MYVYAMGGQVSGWPVLYTRGGAASQAGQISIRAIQVWFLLCSFPRMVVFCWPLYWCAIPTINTRGATCNH